MSVTMFVYIEDTDRQLRLRTKAASSVSSKTADTCMYVDTCTHAFSHCTLIFITVRSPVQSTHISMHMGYVYYYNCHIVIITIIIIIIRCVKMFPPKTREDVGMVQCVPARLNYLAENRRNKEEGWSMQRVGPAGPCNKEGPVHAKPRS